MSENPYRSPDAPSVANQQEELSASKAAYNVVSDTFIGVNTRGRDNWFQAKFIFVSLLVCSVVGALLAWLNPRWQLPWFGGAMLGAFAGLLFGVFGSGIFLMVYRALRHLQGKHD